MKYYDRYVTKREAINRFGKLGYVMYREVVLTDDISQFNYKKRIKFEQAHYEGKELEPNTVYMFKAEKAK